MSKTFKSRFGGKKSLFSSIFFSFVTLSRMTRDGVWATAGLHPGGEAERKSNRKAKTVISDAANGENRREKAYKKARDYRTEF